MQRPAPLAEGSPPGKRMRTVQPPGAQPVRRISNNLPVITTLAQQLQVHLHLKTLLISVDVPSA